MTLPRWLTSTPQQRRSLEGSRAVWRPWGTRHARTVGAIWTACGQTATDWPIFWDIPFRPGDPGSCPQCVEVIRREAHLRASRPTNRSALVLAQSINAHDHR